MTDDPWEVRETDDSWRLYYDGQRWPMEPRATHHDATQYLSRVRERYGGASARVLCEAEPSENGRQRGGPWRWTTPEDATTAEEHGTTGVIQTSTLEDAKSVLRHQMGRKRLPNGIEWEIE